LPLVALLLAVTLAGGGLAAHGARQREAAGAARDLGEAHLRQGHYEAALEAFRMALTLADGLPFSAGLRRQVQEGADQAERGLAAEDLHRVCEELRPLYAADHLPEGQARAIAGHCRDLWEKREAILADLGEGPGRAAQVRADLLDLGILWADLRARLAGHREALAILGQAEVLFGPSCVLACERRTHALALGLAKAGRQAAAPPQRSAWEHYALGRAYLRAGDLEKAGALLDRAVELQPQGLWPNYYKGVCAYRRGRFEDALVAFSACVALAPRTAACLCNRGQAYAALGRLDRARTDYDRALELDPGLAEARELRARLARQGKPAIPPVR
jgi:tetratricopeptide (TPR) repeat protein